LYIQQELEKKKGEETKDRADCKTSEGGKMVAGWKKTRQKGRGTAKKQGLGRELNLLRGQRRREWKEEV